MTREQTDELNRWIAVNVMGFTDVELHHPRGEFPEPDPEPFWRGHAPGYLMWTSVPDYAHDRVAAMDVLMVCHARTCVMVWKAGDIHYCNITGGGAMLGEGSTLPMAIAVFTRKFFTFTFTGKVPA